MGGGGETRHFFVMFRILERGTQRDSPQASTHQTKHSSGQCANRPGMQRKIRFLLSSQGLQGLNRWESTGQAGRWSDGNRALSGGFL